MFLYSAGTHIEKWGTHGEVNKRKRNSASGSAIIGIVRCERDGGTTKDVEL